jgi:TM2 domain-containing membrane protein YozV
VLLLWVGLFGPSTGTPKKVSYCEMCGDPFMVKLRKKRRRDEEEKEEKKPSNYCTQCTYIFKKKTTVKPEKRAQKVGQIQVRQQLRSLVARVGSICLPGAGQIYYGYIGKGLLIACGFYLGFALVLLKVLTKSLLMAEGSGGASLVTIGFGILLMTGTYLFNLYDVTKLSPRNQ